jgi:hypothetical protein
MRLKIRKNDMQRHIEVSDVHVAVEGLRDAAHREMQHALVAVEIFAARVDEL